MNTFLNVLFQVEKIVKDIHGPALALVLERLKPYSAFQGKLVWYLALLYLILCNLMIYQYEFCSPRIF